MLTYLPTLLLFLYAVFDARLAIDTGSGGRGLIQILDVLLILAAVGWGAWYRGHPFAIVGSRLLVLTWGPLLILLLILPTLGVVGGEYAVRTLGSWLTVLIPLAILVLIGSMRPGAVVHAIYGAIVVQGLYGLGQMFYRLGWLPDVIWSWAYRWDQTVQTQSSEAYLIVGRSTGLFINANQYGLWSVLAVLFAFLRLSGRAQWLAVVMGLAGVVSSQSRTALVMLAVVSVLALLRQGLINQGKEKFIRNAIFLIPVILVVGGFVATSSLIEANFLNRLQSGLDTLTGGVNADANLASRTVAWSDALDFAPTHPFGTLGPPQALFGDAIDSQYVALFIQGSIPLLLTYAWALLSPLVMAGHGVRGWWGLALFMAAFAVMSFTAAPLDSTLAALPFWVVLGLELQAWRANLNQRDTWVAAQFMELEETAPTGG